MKTLENTYCRPNEEEWEKIISLLKSIEKYWWRKYDDGRCFLHDNTVYLSNGTIGDWNTRTEIPVQHLIDLLEDRIVPWRLEEIGFNKIADVYFYGVNESNIAVNPDLRITYSYPEIKFNGCKTLTDLQTLIRFLK